MSLPNPYYQDDAVTIYHADCRDILPELPKVDLVLTDPPYGINYKGGTGGNLIHSKGTRKSERVVGDNVEAPIADLLRYDRVALFGGHRYYHLLPLNGTFFVWDKRGDYKPVHTSDYDTIFVNWHTVGRIKRSVWRGICRETECRDRIYHPTQKPLAIIDWILDFTKTTGLVLDPFLGSGTTLVACKKRHLPAIGIEIEERYCEIAARRCSQTVMPLAV